MPLEKAPNSAIPSLEPEVSIVLNDRFCALLKAGDYDAMRVFLKGEHLKNGLKGFPLVLISIEK